MSGFAANEQRDEILPKNVVADYASKMSAQEDSFQSKLDTKMAYLLTSDVPSTEFAKPGDGHAHPVLPAELSDCCIDMLGFAPPSSWPAALKALFACSLVSKAFNHRARQYIFRSVDIFSSPDCSRTKTLHKLMIRKNGLSIAPYIKNFSFETWEEFDEPQLALVFRALHGPDHGITELAFGVPMAWSYMRPGLQAAFLELLRSPRLHTLCLKDVYLPQDILVGIHVKNLTLYACLDDDKLKAGKAPSGATLPLLESLNITFETDLDFFQDGKDSALRDLRHLSFTLFTDEDFENVQSILSKISKTIESLDFHYSTMRLPLRPKERIDLTQLEELTYMRLYHGGSDMLKSSEIIKDTLEDVISFLSAAQPPSTLETLEIVFEMDSSRFSIRQDFMNSFSPGEDLSRWRRLDEILTIDSSPFEDVPDVIITVHFGAHIATALEHTIYPVVFLAHEAIWEALPSLYEEERLVVNIAFSTMSPLEPWKKCNLDGVVGLEDCCNYARRC